MLIQETSRGWRATKVMVPLLLAFLSACVEGPPQIGQEEEDRVVELAEPPISTISRQPLLFHRLRR